MAEVGLSQYSQRELRTLAKAFTLMGEEATDEAKQVAGEMAEYALKEIQQAGYARQKAAGAVRATVDGAKVSKSSKTGDLSKATELILTALGIIGIRVGDKKIQ